MNDLTFNILKIAVTLSTVFISAYLIPLIREKLASSKYDRLLQMVEIAVKAAEQMIGAEYGAVKKDEVLKFVTKWMLEHGVAVSQEQLDQLIECAVFEMKREVK